MDHLRSVEVDAWRLDLVPTAIKVSPVLFGGQEC